jgi:hypothetical protein
VAVDPAAWHAQIARLGWQVCLTSTTAAQYTAVQMMETYHGQTVQ